MENNISKIPAIQHAQTVLLADDIERLKIKTNKQNTKDALASAVDYILNHNCKEEDMRRLLKICRVYIASMSIIPVEAERILEQIDILGGQVAKVREMDPAEAKRAQR